MGFKKRITTIILFIISVILICTHYVTAHAFKTDAEQEWQAEEVESFVKAFYEAHTEKDIEKAREQMLEDDAGLYIIRYQVFFEFGFQKYDNITVKAYSMRDKKNWLVFVEYEAFFESIDIGIPGSVTVLVQRQEDGQGKILMDCPEDMYEEALQIMEAKEITEWFYEVNEEYNEIIRENHEIMNYFIELSNSVDKAVLEAMENKDAGSTAGKVNDIEMSEKEIYTVRKGDCLWRIAQNELGDGRYWEELYEGNKDVIGDDPNLILIGIQLKIE